MSKLVAILGTSSSAGKSTIVLVLARLLRKRGLKVAPFKPQNMSLNSTSTWNGEEIAYAQYIQCIACESEPTALNNPVLLKPHTSKSSELIVLGKSIQLVQPGNYYNNITEKLREVIAYSLRKLLETNDVVIMEGAGAGFEPNLASRDIANIYPLLYCIRNNIDLKVIIVTDIYRGGAYTSLLGLYTSLPKSIQRHVVGFLINKFCGDEKILENANKWLRSRTGKEVLGVLEYRQDLDIMPEDSLNISPKYSGKIDIAIVAYPYMSNFNEFHMLRFIDDIAIRYVRTPHELGEPDIIILPGSRNVFESLKYLKNVELDRKLYKLAGSTLIVGICGGFQILSNRVSDPHGLEQGFPSHMAGLGLLDTEFVYGLRKTVSRTVALTIPSNIVEGDLTVLGYEIHRGIQLKFRKPLFRIVQRNRENMKSELEGCVDEKNLVIGTSIHESLLNVKFLNNLLKNIGKKVPEVNVFDIYLEYCDKAVTYFSKRVYIENLL